MSGLVFEKLTQTLSAGQVWRLSIAADFFRIAAAAWPVKVRILKAGRILGEMDGWQAGDFVRDVEFDAVEIEAGSIAQTVTVQIAGGGVGSDRVLGEVSVIDGGKARTLSGNAFFGTLVAGPGVGFYSVAEIWNPAGSGKKLIVSQLAVSSGVDCFLYVRGMTTALANDATSFGSKMIGAPTATVAKFKRSSAEATIPGTPLMGFKVKAAVTEWVSLREPIVIAPGVGLCTSPNIVNAEAAMAVEFIEEEE